MKTLKSFCLFIIAILCLLPKGSLAYTVRVHAETDRPTFKDAQEEKLYQLNHGEIFSEGGYLDHGAWAKMEGVVNAPPEVVWRLFLRVEGWRAEGLPNFKEGAGVSDEVVKELGASSKLNDYYRLSKGRAVDASSYRRMGAVWQNNTFQYYNIPWPLSDRWMIAHSHYDESKLDQGIYLATWKNSAGNIRYLTGRLYLEPFNGDKNRTRMEYEVQSDPGSHVPKFVLKWGTRRTLPLAMKAIRQAAQKVYGRPPPLLQIQNNTR